METKVAADKKKLQDQCSEYLELFSIAKSDLVPHSYSDLLMQKS